MKLVMEDIDKAQVYGAGHPMGTFRLMDLTGIDLNLKQRFRKTAISG
jgi:3-hydroxybutyryl-CoA dehydrogenase